MRRMAKLACVAAVLCAALPALAAPSGGTDYVLLVDNTGTMRYGGRAEETIEGLRAFVGLMRPGDRVSVLSYGERVDAVLRHTPTEIANDESKQQVLSQLRFAFDADRTDITAAVERVWQDRESLFPRRSEPTSGRGHANAVVVLMTDGKLIPVYDDYSRYDSIFAESSRRLLGLARLLGDERIPVHVVAVGSMEKVGSELTEELAALSGGIYYIVEDATEVADTYVELMDEMGGTSELYAEGAPDVSDPESVAEDWVAQDRKPYGRGASWVQYIPEGLFERYASVLAVFVGAVAVGVDRRKRWALAFTQRVGKPDVRVRGYLRPVDPPGTFSARPIVGLENPGLATVKVGLDTPYVEHARDTVVEFVGTNDGTPPELLVERGRVLVEGEEVQGSRKLKDGDIIEIEKVCYRYLRGNRR